jgi:hypothetical protein
LTSFIHDPRRDATSTIRGFVYQVDLTVQRWVALKVNEALELERGEDIDIVGNGLAGDVEESRILEQVKSRAAPVTLRSGVTVECVANFALHRERNPELRLLFRFTTNAFIATEVSSAFAGGQPGIVAWKRLRERDLSKTEEGDITSTLRRFYLNLERPSSTGTEAWKALRRLVERGDDDEWLTFLTSFEWSTEYDAASNVAAAIRHELVTRGWSVDDARAREHHRRLFEHVMRLLTFKGEKRLKHQDLASVLVSAADQEADRRISSLFERFNQVDARVEAVENRVAVVEAGTAAQMSAFDVGLRAIESLLASGDLPAVKLGELANPATDPPLPLKNRIGREALVTKINGSFRDGWLALHGETGSGKSQLAHLLAGDDPSSVMWLRLTDVPASAASFALRRAFESRTGSSPTVDRATLFRAALTSTSPVRTIVLDDLPRLDSRGPFVDVLRILAIEAAAATALVLSTSVHRLPSDVAPSLGESFSEVPIPGFSHDDVRQLLYTAGAPASQAQALAGLVHTLGDGHAGLIAGIAQYLRSRNWIVSTEELGELLAGQHATPTRRELLNRLLTSVSDDETRQLLYRMTLAIGDLTLKEVRGLADSKPSINRPDERLSQLEGLWVQVENDQHIRVPAPVRLLETNDLDDDVRRFCYGRLAMMRIRRGSLSPVDVLKVIAYFTGANAHHYAGLAAAQAFIELERLGPIPDSGLSDWFSWPLPAEMPNGTKLLVRGTQLGMRLKWGKDIEFLLSDIDAILDEATEPFERSVVFIAAGKLLVFDPDKAWRALPLLRRAMSAHDAASQGNAPVVTVPDSLWIESILLAGHSVRDASQLQEWQLTVESLPQVRRGLLDSSQNPELAYMTIANNILLVEHRKPQDAQDWSHVLDVMKSLAAWALRMNLPLLHAHATRIELVVLGEYMHDFDTAGSVASTASRENSDERSIGIIEIAMGKQLNLKNRWSDAREWFARGLARPSSGTPLHFEALLAAANAEQGFSLATSIKYLREAVSVSDFDSLLTASQRFSARAEMAVALLLDDDRNAAVTLWEDAATILLHHDPSDDRDKGRIALFLKRSGYFYIVAVGGLEAVRLITPDRRPRTPLIGEFEGDLAPLAKDVDRFWRARVQVLLGKLAKARSESEGARVWGQRALDSIREQADAPAVIGDEARRLAGN